MRATWFLAIGALLLTVPTASAGLPFPLDTLGDCDPYSPCYCLMGEFLEKPHNLGFLDGGFMDCGWQSCVSGAVQYIGLVNYFHYCML